MKKKQGINTKKKTYKKQKQMNRFYAIPVEDLKVIDPDWETRRKNVDETEAIIHVETFDALIAERNREIMPLGDIQGQEIPYPVYQGEELTELLNSPEWTGERQTGETS